MEKFMLVFRGSDVYERDQSPKALEALSAKMMDWVGNLVGKGIHVASEKLQRTGKQVLGLKKTVTENPFGEDKEIIGGCTIVLAKDYAEALDIANACPILESNASIEIRQIQGF